MPGANGKPAPTETWPCCRTPPGRDGWMNFLVKSNDVWHKHGMYTRQNWMDAKDIVVEVAKINQYISSTFHLG